MKTLSYMLKELEPDCYCRLDLQRNGKYGLFYMHGSRKRSSDASASEYSYSYGYSYKQPEHVPSSSLVRRPYR